MFVLVPKETFVRETSQPMGQMKLKINNTNEIRC